jgi:hypothetical protein
MRKSLISLSLLGFLTVTFAHADEGVVINRFGSCDYYIVDGPRGLYVLEWFGGYDPSEGDRIIGEIGSYGIKEVIFGNGRSGKVLVEDFLESTDAAMDEIRDHC